MRKLRKYTVRNAFKGFLPKRSDFETVEEQIPTLQNGEFLIKTEYISVDPYMRSFANGRRTPYDQFGFQVGKVIESKNSEYPTGVYVVSHSGWRDFAVLNGEPDDMFNMKPYQPPIGDLPISISLGALGMPGMTAYLGLLEICKPKRNNIICVTSAAGAVGLLVGQIARLKGCTVIGFTGSDEKVHILKQEYGFHHVFNYKSTTNIRDTLKLIAPSGINCFFDNVGGELSAAIMDCMQENGQVAICGSISNYGDSSSHHIKQKYHYKIEAFSFTQWEWSEQSHALTQLKIWIDKGDIKVKETVTDGFEKLPHAFVGMLKGENVGKAVVKI
uniref:15-oxoprostaglandin 13-reductase n=1 Tax=Streltzoviella insularis TaxID=1206366 RepID=A0A7D5YVP0_9NEOP|nr:alcohol dehydrogenase 6 [Streltzoviella insularis]